MARVRPRSAFCLGFGAASLASWAYVEWGTWDLPTPWTFSAPQPAWARALFAPGVAVARGCFDHLFRDHLAFRPALWLAAVCGIVTMGVIGGGIGLCIAALQRRR